MMGRKVAKMYISPRLARISARPARANSLLTFSSRVKNWMTRMPPRCSARKELTRETQIRTCRKASRALTRK
ncbi:MAG: hypothetical protein BWY88_01448 [Synergistetes bacterium ADurb.Bin520]|nr:MAG: hypothetical protein BWY88_01448 [Synergistetes bacterium ADurb.Bin520]